MERSRKTKSDFFRELKNVRGLLELLVDYSYRIEVRKGGAQRLDWMVGDFEAVTGYTAEDMADVELARRSISYPGDTRLFDSLERSTLEGRSEEVTARIVRKDGSVRWIKTVERPEWDEDGGRVVARLGAVRDVTDQLQTRDELRRYREGLEDAVDARTAEVRQVIAELRGEIEERRRVEKDLESMNEVLESFFSTVHLKIAYMDRDFNFIQVNRAYAQAEGKSPNYFIGKNHFDLYPHKENERVFRRVVETGEPYMVFARPFEYPNRPEADVTYWDWTLHPITGGSDEAEGVVLYLLDVTERERLRHELEEQRAQAIHADRLRSLGEMAAGISHELNQPLMGIRNMAEHLQIGLHKGWEFSPGDIEDKMSDILAQVDRMSHVIGHARLFARGGGEDHMEQMSSVNDVIDDAMSLVGTQLKSRGISLIVEKGEDLPPVLLNPFSLEEVILNLVNNSRDALVARMEEGEGPSSPTLAVRSYRAAEKGRELACVEVEDQGPGMDPEVQKRAFEPFFSTKDPGSGTGLGLAICRSLVERFGGRIYLSSELEEGTKVTVKIPARTETQEKEGAE